MTEFPRFGPAPKLADAAVIRRLDINDIATMRRLHVSSFARLAGPTYTEFETRAVVSMLLADTYSDARYAAMSRGCILGAEYQGRLVGTVEWTDPSSPNAAVAINQLFVDPLFTRCGVGTRLMLHAEKMAVNAGFGAAGVSTTVNATGFFERLSYEVRSSGQMMVGEADAVAVAFMRKALRAEPIALP